MKRAFSVTELLVVILIVVIAAGLLLPSFLSSRQSANRVVCASNMHQIYLAMKLYEADHDAYPPNSVTFRGFRSYYPVILTCPASRHKLEPGLRGADYELLGNVIGHVWPLPQAAYDAFDACRAKRGPDFPLVVDTNHIPLLIPLRPDGTFIYVIRESGAWTPVPSVRFGRHERPCDEALLAQDFNF